MSEGGLPSPALPVRHAEARSTQDDKSPIVDKDGDAGSTPNEAVDRYGDEGSSRPVPDMDAEAHTHSYTNTNFLQHWMYHT